VLDEFHPALARPLYLVLPTTATARPIILQRAGVKVLMSIMGMNAHWQPHLKRVLPGSEKADVAPVPFHNNATSDIPILCHSQHLWW